MRELLEKRVVLMAGKGGVGRTTLTAALGSAAASQGKRTLLADLQESTVERPSSLAQLFNRRQLPKIPEEVMPGVDATLIQTEWGTELFLRSVFKNRSVVAMAMRSKSLQRLLHAAPSFREMGMFFHLLHLVSATRDNGAPLYDKVIVDLPATGHALAMTSLPDIMLSLISSGPVARAFQEGQLLFQNPGTTATWVVTLPELLPVTECIELLQGLQDSRMPIGGVILNRRPTDPFSAAEWQRLDQWRKTEKSLGQRKLDQLRLASSARATLGGQVQLPILTLPELAHEGLPLVQGLAQLLAEGA